MQVFQMIATIFYERRDEFEKLWLDKVDRWTIVIIGCFGQEIIRQKTFSTINNMLSLIIPPGIIYGAIY
jgi:hypothetical protein